MTITLRQAAIADLTPHTATLGGAIVQDNFLVAFAEERSGGTAFTMSNSGWTAGPALAQSPSDGTYRKSFATWFKVAEASEPTTVTVTTTGGAAPVAVGYAELQGDAGEMAGIAANIAAMESVITGSDTAASFYDSGTTAAVVATSALAIGACFTKVAGSLEHPYSDWTAGTDDLTEFAERDGGDSNLDHSWAFAVLTNSGTHSTRATKDASTTDANRGAITSLMVFPIATGGGTTPVTATRATTWDTRASVTSSRATTWDTRAEVTATRAATYDVRASVTGTRATTWDVRSEVTSTRATSWNVRAEVTSSRVASWDVRSSVTSSRSTTWDVLESLTATRTATWDTRATVTATRATTWDVQSSLVSVTATRATTWRTMAQVTDTRAVTWDTRVVVESTRAASWDVLTVVSASRVAMWDALAAVTASRAVSWRALAAISNSRATTWNVLSDAIIPDVIEHLGIHREPSALTHRETASIGTHKEDA